MSPASRLRHDPAWHLAGLMGLAIAAGGGGVGAGVGNLAVQLSALVVMALHPQAFSRFFLRKPDWLTALATISLLVPLLQIVPLPPAIWSALPGRDMLAASLDANAGGSGSTTWFPLSLYPGRTLVAAIGLIAPLTILVLGKVLPGERLYRVAGIVAGIGVAAMLFGALGLLDPDIGYLYENANTHYGTDTLIGTFADRNANALFFDACLLLLIGLPSRDLPHWRLAMRTVGGLLLAVGVILTQSRTGLALLAVPLALLGLKGIVSIQGRGGTAPAGHASSPPSPRMLAGGVVVLAIVAAGIAAAGLAGHGRLASTLDRLQNAEDGKRQEMREDALKTARHYWPAGAGTGTFSEVFQVDESLEYLSPLTAGRAHMDYYELAIESGIAGIAVLAAWVLWIACATWKALRRVDWMALAGAGILACIAAQSVLSFPLRNQTVLAMAALALVLLGRAMRQLGGSPA